MSAKYSRLSSNRQTSKDRVTSRVIRKKAHSKPRQARLWRDYSPPRRTSWTPTPPPAEAPDETELNHPHSEDHDGDDYDTFAWQAMLQAFGIDELLSSTQDKQEPAPSRHSELLSQEFEPPPQIMVDHLHFYRDGVTLILTPIPPPDPKIPNSLDPRPHMSVRSVLEDRRKLLFADSFHYIFTVYSWEWDPLSHEMPHIKVWRTENCLREANRQASIFVRAQLSRYDAIDRDYLPEADIDRNSEYIDLDYNPMACHLYEYRTKRLSNGKEYRAWVTMSALQICDTCQGPADKW